jgi:hypothetical protein
MKLVKRIDLLIKEVMDTAAQDNFVRIRDFIDSLFTVALGKDRDNVMGVGSSITFSEITNLNTQVDSFRVPVLAGAPTVAPLSSGSGFVVWDSVNGKLYVWDGAAWQAMN